MIDIKKIMAEVASLNKTHGVTQKGGKRYTQVVHRVEAFRKHVGFTYGIETDLIIDDGKRVIVKATIKDLEGIVIGSDYAEEIRNAGYVNKTSAIENCCTSAIGRALSSIGLSGGEYASSNEMDAVDRKKQASKEPVIKHNGTETTRTNQNLLTALQGSKNPVYTLSLPGQKTKKHHKLDEVLTTFIDVLDQVKNDPDTAKDLKIMKMEQLYSNNEDMVKTLIKELPDSMREINRSVKEFQNAI